MGIINLQGVTKIYQTKEVETVALENVNLEVKAGEFLSVMGPSGCGKSTMLNLIGLLDVPTEGAVTVDGAATGRMKDAEMAEFRNKTLGFVFQSFHLINSLNVLDNVELPLLYRKSTEKSRRETARAVLEKVGLSDETLPFAAFGRTVPTGGDRAGANRQSENHPGRRTDRQPRQQNGRRDHAPAVRTQPGRDDHRHGDPRRAHGPKDAADRPLLRRTAH